MCFSIGSGSQLSGRSFGSTARLGASGLGAGLITLLLLSGCGEGSLGDAAPLTGAGGGAGGVGGAGASGDFGEFTTTGGGAPGASGAGGAAACGNVLTAIVRDFNDSHPDFEDAVADDRGIVRDELGPDLKPVYAGNPRTATTSGKEAFDQWYRDVPGVNMTIPISIELSASDRGTFIHEKSRFFPINGMGFGNQGRSDNFHFTLEIHTEFEYKGGEVFTFRGDDDIFTFINGKLAINLGGVHYPQEASVDLDARAQELGLTPGKVYKLDFFFAERHTGDSNFRLETSIACFANVDIPR
jgi:fibro-slime domain-containing protein